MDRESTTALTNATAGTDRPKPKYHKGQIVILKHSKKILPFRILDVTWNDGWFYAWNRKNYASEGMIRPLNEEELGRSQEQPR